MSLLEFQKIYKHSYFSGTTIIQISYNSLTEAPCEFVLLEDRWAKDECFKSSQKLGNAFNDNHHQVTTRKTKLVHNKGKRKVHTKVPDKTITNRFPGQQRNHRTHLVGLEMNVYEWKKSIYV